MFSFKFVKGATAFFDLNKFATSGVDKREQKAMMYAVAKILRSNFGSNLTKQVDIDGRSFEPRKQRVGFLNNTSRREFRKYGKFLKKGKRKKRVIKMLTGFRKYIDRKFQNGFLSVGVMGKGSGLASIHNLGKTQTFKRKNGDTRTIDYAKRQFVGYGEVQDKLLSKEIEVILKRKMKSFGFRNMRGYSSYHAYWKG